MAVGVLLTGGRSRRLGTDKASVKIGGMTLAEKAAATLQAVCEVSVEVGAGVSTLPAVREDPVWSGPLAALLAGIDAIEELHAVDAVVLFGCDYPRVTPELLAMLAARAEAGAFAVPFVRERYQYGVAGYPASAVTQLREAYARGERGFRWLDATLADEPPLDESWWGSIATADAFRDLDTPADAVALGISLADGQ